MSQHPGPHGPEPDDPNADRPHGQSGPYDPPSQYGPPNPYGQPEPQPGAAPEGYGQQPGASPYGQPGAPYAQQPMPNQPQAQPQPQPQPGYAPPPGPQAGDALSWAWSAFSRSAGAWIGGMLVWGVLMALAIAIPVVLIGVSGAFLGQSAPGQVPVGGIIGLILSAVLLLVLLIVVAILMTPALYSAARKAADGGTVTFGDVMRPRRVGTYLVTSILLWLISMVASIIPIVGSIAAGYLFWFAPNAVVQEDEDGPIDSLVRSWNLTTGHFSSVVVGYLIFLGLNVAGSLIVIGLVVTMPLTILLATFYHRALHGRAVAPAA